MNYKVLTNPLSPARGLQAKSGNYAVKRRSERKEKLPSWWPESLPSPVIVAGKQEYQREADKLVRAIVDYKMSGKDYNYIDFIQLRHICKVSGAKVSFETENSRDSFYRAAVDFVMNSCSSVLQLADILKIDGEEARQFIVGLNDNIGLDKFRSATIVRAAVAALTRSHLLQCWIQHLMDSQLLASSMSEILAPEDLADSSTGYAPAGIRLPSQRGDGKPSVDLELREGTKEVEGEETGRGGGVGSRRMYSREEMEAMQFLMTAVQQQWWKEVYQGMGEAVAREYDQLRAPNSRKKNKNNKKKKLAAKENEVPPLVGQEFDATSTKSSNDFNPYDLACDGSGFAHEDILVAEEECCDDGLCNDDDSSNDEYDSIWKPAFFVEGEPDFDSGPPLDGLEYLRRVRWEASQIPKVKVAKLKSSGQVSEQTSYMPKIPEIATCPSHLFPSNHWEEVFLADFKELRKAFLGTEDPCEQPLTLRHDEPSGEGPACAQMPTSAPTTTLVRGMDAVARAVKLRNYISLFESSNMLSTHDCQWLFALSMAVDTPFDADTSASLRCLLRKCSNLLANKSQHDDEVAMLNILITITGKYFGQSERRAGVNLEQLQNLRWHVTFSMRHPNYIMKTP